MCRFEIAEGRALLDTPAFETVANEVFRREARLWKPSTLAVNRSYLSNQILPFFGKRRITDITSRDIQRWFTALHATPAAANRALPVLSVILRGAESLGHRPQNSNPCLGIRRYRLRGRNRFLTTEEIRRLGTILDMHQEVSPQPVAVVRLLLLTGCRQGEVRHLRWEDYRQGHLYLRDSKTGPKTVWLSSPARAVFDALPRTSAWIFPAIRDEGPMRTDTLYRHWREIRNVADLSDIRLHDLRHTYASFALRHGETLLTIGRLLGHRDPSTTLQYLHINDALALSAARNIGETMAV